MPYRFKLTDVIPATPSEIYDTWLSSRGHRAMTGGKAKQSTKVGASVTAWDGYISGKNLMLVPGKRIVQSWRTTRFTGEHKDSRITVTLKPLKDGTRITLVHSGVPDGQTSYEKGGWQSHYFEPMKAYFAKRRRRG
jgi:activator of HSP90 ATPase